MSQNPNYFKIGLFVIAGILFLAVAIIIFGAGKFFEKKYIVETYFDPDRAELDSRHIRGEAGSARGALH